MGEKGNKKQVQKYRLLFCAIVSVVVYSHFRQVKYSVGQSNKGKNEKVSLVAVVGNGAIRFRAGRSVFDLEMGRFES